jgi:uncharacterized membrane-anchored protein
MIYNLTKPKIIMRHLTARTAVLTLLLGGLAFAFQKKSAPEPEAPPFEFERCPCTAKLADLATIRLPKGTVFLDKANAGKFLEYNHNLPDGDEVGVVVSEDGKWFVIYSFQDVGYVKDDEKSELDSDGLLKSMTEATEAGNEERRKRGWGTMRVVGWHEKPHYDVTSHNLEWSIIGQSEKGGQTVNHNSRFLGRRGVMSANLVSSPEDINETLAAFRSVSAGFGFTPDNHYTAFVKGDKVAEYGLTALVLGGATAAAVKTGFLKSALKLLAAFWKLILLAVLGLGGIVMKGIRAMFRKPEEQPSGEISG